MDSQGPGGAPRPPQGGGIRGGVGGGDTFSILTVMLAFITIGAMILVLASNSTFSILHQVPEGHVGVYWRGGALLKTITDPGFHMMMPLITQFEPIQVTPQTYQLEDIPCGTKGGVMINFEKLEVVTHLCKDYVYETLLNYGVQYDKTWIYDKIRREINQLCSAQSLQQVYIDKFDQIGERMKEALQMDCTSYAPGIEILSVHVTQPTIPQSIRRNFENMEEEHTKVLMAVEKQKVAEKEAGTPKKIVLADTEDSSPVNKIRSAKMQEEIDNQRYLAREKSLADAVDSFVRPIHRRREIFKGTENRPIRLTCILGKYLLKAGERNQSTAKSLDLSKYI
ncbi:hypothetical protein MKW94_012430 [Papaver nudicaule]|uniref:Band 7 domain-containing protein n=1 Tax=Papaver nudicaule TaxID=74823 RepID=A0AA41V5A5_PAPNU|nr:hypothetical protein [Papaver nudicaule]